LAERTVAARRQGPRNVTEGRLAPHMWALAWPAMLTQALMMFPGLYDAIWLGRLGHEAQAAAGLAMTVRFTMISVLMALSTGSGAVVARYVGAEDCEGADLAVMQGVILMALSSGLLGLIGVVFARPLMVWAGADETVLPLAVRYARIMFAGLIALELVPSVGFMLSSAGAPHVVLAMTLWGTGTLLVVEPLLARWLGIDGAALALVGSNTVGMLWGLGVLVSGRGPIHLDLRRLRIDLSMMGRILRVALPAVVQRGTPNFANLLLTRFVSAYGSSTLAAWIVVRRIFQFATIPGMALSRVAPTMVGQNLGASKPERAQRAVDILGRVAALTSAVVLGVLAALALPVLGLFSGDAETISAGTYIVRVLCVGYLAFSVNWVYDAAQGGAGDTTPPMVINVVSLLAIQVLLAFLLSRFTRLEANGIWLALNLGYVVQFGLMWLRYRQGQWKEKRI
jgi:putative MATE family efflux protein